MTDSHDTRSAGRADLRSNDDRLVGAARLAIGLFQGIALYLLFRMAEGSGETWSQRHPETFGPLVSIYPVTDDDDAVRRANDSEYGLGASIWTRDLGVALRVSRAVDAGNLSVNSHASVRYWTPFGGFKQSGLGRELGPDAPHAFTDVKNIFISNE